MEENNNGELTFKKIWQHVKKSGVRIIVYALVALVVCGGILGICDIFVSESQYSTNITFYYSGAENGETPWGGQEDVVAAITSASNVSAALDKLQYSDEVKDELVSLIIKNLSVVVSIKETKDDEDTVVSGNYSYTVVLSQNSKIDKFIDNRNAYNNIVSAITSNYIENFKLKFSFALGNFDSLTLSDSYNAFQKYDIIKGGINSFLDATKLCSEKATTFVSTSQKMTFGNLQNRIETVLLPKLAAYSDFVASNGIDAKNEKDYVNKMLVEATKEVEVREKAVEECSNALTSLANGNVSTPNGSIIVNPANPEVLNKALEDLSVARAKRDAAVSNKNFWERCQKDYENAQVYADKTEDEKTALTNSAKALEDAVVEEYNALIGSYKLMVEEYNDSYSISSIARITSVAKQHTTSPLTLKIFAVVELMVLIIAVIVAMIVTSKKGSMVLKKKQGVDAQEQQEKAVEVVEEVKDENVDGANI